MFQDAIAATVPLRLAVAVTDHGLAAGLAQRRAELAAVASQCPDDPLARRPVPGLTGLPARPGQYVRDIHRRLQRGGLTYLDDPGAAQFVTQRLARARDYGLVVREAVTDCFEEIRSLPDAVRSWAASTLPRWRSSAGYASVRPPQEWHQPPVFSAAAPLAEAVAAHPRTPLLCALVLAITSCDDPPPVTAVTAPGAVTVPGYPASRLSDEDGPWRRAWPDARELGAAIEPFWRRVADRGLLVSTAWLGPGGWPALWGRAARHC